MLTKNKVIITIAVHDIENSMDFYGDVLGLKKVGESRGGILFECGGATIGLYQSTTAGTGLSTCAWWIVDDVETTVKGLRARGVTFDKNYDIPHAKSKGDIYDMGEGKKAAWFKDIDGNVLGLGNF
ncbi:MAG: glyoxalase [Candidatus Saccharibacteria bacterium]|nr:glyoxalase [Candidatus Saccharibacteria bacterium]